jgi:Tfp pilus assembly protein PilF
MAFPASWQRALLAATAAVAAGGNLASAAELTFNKDIAPLLWKHCAGCHRPGASAPFSLIEYKDVVPRARQIVAATRNRVMPPWLPEPGHGEFADVRRLAPEEIDRIDQWVQGGAREGRAADRGTPPQWTEGWQLGTPDLVVTLPVSYRVPDTQSDMFRSFVLPIPLKASTYVRGVEIRPGNTKLVHHASVSLDRTSGSRRLDDADGEPGFAGGMISEGARTPESRAIGWTPGIMPAFEPDGMAWRLDPGTDLIVNLHLLAPTQGETELVQPSVGFYFTSRPPTRLPIDFKLGSKAIDIPSGSAAYTVEDAYTLPVDVEVLSVYPHAHYLATDMKASAKLPDGTVKPLLWIKRWSFHWQDEYRFATPVFLPKDSTVTMTFTYDNSAANQRDRRRPPSRVTFGPQSSNEMGDLWLRLLPRSPADAEALARGYRERELEKDIAATELLAAAQPRDARHRNALALAYMRGGRVAEAMAQLETAIRLDPEQPETHNNLGQVLQRQGRLAEALPHFREAVRLRPSSEVTHLSLANALQEAGEVQESIRQFRIALVLNPELADAHNNLGVALGSLGELEEAEAHFLRALQIQPNYPDAQANLTEVSELLKSLVRPQ